MLLRVLLLLGAMVVTARAQSLAITAPAGSFTVSGTVTISGTVSGLGGNSIAVTANGVALGNATVVGSAWSIVWTPTTVADFTLRASFGSVAATAAVSVTGLAPTVGLALSPSNSTIPVGSARYLIATATDDSAIDHVEFSYDGTLLGSVASAPYVFLFTAPNEAGTHHVTARAFDNSGLSTSASVLISITTAIGSGPTVALVAPSGGATFAPGVTVSLVASASDSDGTIASVQFYSRGVPVGSAVTAPPYTTSLANLSAGASRLEVIATDDKGNSAISTVATITAVFSSPAISITSPKPDPSAPNGVVRVTPNVPLTITATAAGGGGAAVLLVEYLIDGVQVGTRTSPTTTGGTTYSFAWTPTSAQLGTHVLTTRVTDVNSISTTSSAINLNVAAIVGTPPTVSISAPTGTITSPAVIQSLSTVSLIANAFASGAGNSLTSVEFFLNDTSAGLGIREQATNFYRLPVNFGALDFSGITPDSNGRFPVALYAVAKDSNGNQTISATTNLAVASSTSAAPSVQLSGPGTNTVTQGTPFPLTATLDDLDGSVVSLQLFANGSTSGSAIPNPGSQVSLNYPAATAGRFNLYVVATDDTGNTAVSSPPLVVTVTAISPPVTAMVRPADDATVTTVGSLVFLEATATSGDPTQTPTVTFIATATSGARTVISGVTRIGTTNNYRANWTPVAAGTFTVSSSATIGTVTGTSATARRVVVNNVVGIAPTVTLTTSAGGSGIPAVVTTSSQANLTATATDPDGTITGVEFFVNRSSIGQAVRDQLTSTWRIAATFANVPLGANEVVALATDNAGNVDASPVGTITVNAPSSIAPTLTFTASPATVAFSRQVQLTSSALDPDGAVVSVQYFSNGVSIGQSGNAGTNYLVNWTPNVSGTFNVYAVATDNSGNTTVAPATTVTVRPNNPVQDDDAFILQTYTDIANASVPNALVFANLDAQFTAGTLTRAQLVNNLTSEAGFAPPANLLAAYYAIMGQWPTPANYLALLPTARTSLPNAIGAILSSPEYVAKFGPSPTAAAFNSSYPTFNVFATRLWQNAGLGAPTVLQVFQFQNNDTLLPALGRGYAVTGVGLNAAIAEFVTNTCSTSSATLKRATAAALYYQLDKPPVTHGTDQIALRIAELTQLASITAIADAVLKDQLYLYRYVTITTQPQSLTVIAGASAVFSVTATGAPPLSYQWLFNGSPIAGATSSSLTITGVNSTKTGAYSVVVTSTAASATSQPAVLGLATTSKFVGAGIEVAHSVVNANGNTYDQVLMQGDATTITADPGKITRLSFIDLSNDIVQVEFSGAGTLSLLLDNASGPVAATNYNQPEIAYMKGHAGIVIIGADETTNLSIFSVGSVTATNQSLFRSDVVYDGVADLGYVAILSTDGKFGGLRSGNASYFATKGYAGIYAPGVEFVGPVIIGDISAADDATPVLLLGASTDTRVAGGDLFQANGAPVAVSGVTKLKFTAGTKSTGALLPAQINRAHLEQNGSDVTDRVVANPAP